LFFCRDIHLGSLCLIRAGISLNEAVDPGESTHIWKMIFPMINHVNKQKNTAMPVCRQSYPDRIGFLAEKYGVSRTTVLIAMSITGPNEALIEEILEKNRFVR
jgi:hypothetical protein